MRNLWRICSLVMVLLLVSAAVWLVVRKVSPLGEQTGGSASKTPSPRISPPADKPPDQIDDVKSVHQPTSKSNEETAHKTTQPDTLEEKVELAAKANSEDLKSVDTKVTGVQADLDTTRNDLKMARSEMGTLIARNHDEIDELRRLGERDYYEFFISKNKPSRVGNVVIELKRVDKKRTQFSIAITIEDKRFEKPNREINEPIFFYETGIRIPDEIVINRIGENTVTGYLSRPKAKTETKPGDVG